MVSIKHNEDCNNYTHTLVRLNVFTCLNFECNINDNDCDGPFCEGIQCNKYNCSHCMNIKLNNNL